MVNKYTALRYWACIQLQNKQAQVPIIFPKFGLWARQRQKLKPVTVKFLRACAKFAKKKFFYSDATRCVFSVS